MALRNFVKVDPNTLRFAGLTGEGIAALTRARDSYRQRSRLWGQEFRQLDDIFHLLHLIRLSGSNVYFYGPPGGAKSKTIDWFLKGERSPSFKIQLNMMTPEQVFIGGQVFEAAQRGKFHMNFEGSLAEFVTGLIDEVDKGNPAVLGALMRLMNEREVLAGGQVFKALTEALFLTSNASLPQFIQHFRNNGFETVADALLNRLGGKAYIFNWLSESDQMALTLRGNEQRRLEGLLEANRGNRDLEQRIRAHEIFEQPEPLDWDEMGTLAKNMFDYGSDFEAAYSEMANELRPKTIQAETESQKRNKANVDEEPFVYKASADWGERLRGQIHESVLRSAFLDFLLSPLADDENLKNGFNHKIILDAFSVWRMQFMASTQSMGRTRFVVQRTDNGQFAYALSRSWSFNAQLVAHAEDQAMLCQLQAERDLLDGTFMVKMEKAREALATLAALGGDAAPAASQGPQPLLPNSNASGSQIVAPPQDMMTSFEAQMAFYNYQRDNPTAAQAAPGAGATARQGGRRSH